MRKHDLDLNTNRASTEVAVANGVVDEDAVGSSGLDHVAVTERHALGTLALDLATDDDFATLGASLHHVADDASAGTADLEVAEELEAEGLCLGHGRQATGIHALHIQLNAVLGVAETLLDARGELANAAALLSEDFLRLRGADDDLRALRRNAVLDACEAILSELALEEFVKLSVEHSVAHELSLLAERAHGLVFIPLPKKKKKEMAECTASKTIHNNISPVLFFGLFCFNRLLLRKNSFNREKKLQAVEGEGKSCRVRVKQCFSKR